MNAIRFCLASAPLLAIPMLTGCLETYAVQEQRTAQQEDIAIMQEKVRRIEGRLEGFDLAIQQLQRAVEVMRAQPVGPSQADLQALQTRLTTLDSQLRTLDAARQKDRQEIVDTVSTKIAALVNANSRPPPSRNATPPRRSGTQEGYEHVVAPGETLSAIASAYNARSKDIIDANNLTNPSALKVGQKLFIPAP